MTNREFAEVDVIFRECCKLAKVEPTKRQASKFLMGKGRARRNLPTIQKRKFPFLAREGEVSL